ncbi:MAG TPA: FAD:protein FMN transferase, partial [Candidatus Binatia bacterium]|nr:FAD:protein FMN transferase [Candidatus Binatia bacterium]
GKGLALRWAWRRARRSLRPSDGALLEAGGDLVAATPSPDIGPWRIGVEDPAAAFGADPLAVIAVDRGAVATSSVAVHRWSVGGRVVHHLIDPTTGEPGGAGLLAVTVATSDPAWAEVWTKSLFLAGRAGVATEARSRGLAVWWVTEDETLEMTPAARLLTIWSRADR